MREQSARRKPRTKGIPRDLADETYLLPLSDFRSPVTERYRRIRTYVDHLAEHDAVPIRTLVVGSSREGEGKTLTAMNLALVLAEDRDSSVVLVDCDLHKPRIHTMFRAPVRLGLMDVYEGRADLDACLLSLTRSRLHVLPAGRVEGVNPAEVLKSAKFASLLETLKDRYDYVVIDTPPVMRFVDANVLNGLSDGMVFVVRAGLTSRQVVQRALESVTNGRILGVVLNDVRYTVVDRLYYRYDDYGKSYYDE
jgi:receptor protein-tyrosine kinase/non-specific protein-tyrosine kinase